MACACQNKHKTYEVIPKAGTATRPAFTSSSQGTAEAVADRYPTAIVRDKKTSEPVYFAWPKGTYEVVLQAGDGPVLKASAHVRNGSDRGTLKALADDRAGEGAVVRSTTDGTVVYPLAAALTAAAVQTAPATP